MKLYIDMEPQPEFFDNNIPGLTSGCMGLIYKGKKYSIGEPADFKYSELVKDHAPYKPGDKIDRCEMIDTKDPWFGRVAHTTKGTVKSCTPIQRDGRWKWEVEV